MTNENEIESENDDESLLSPDSPVVIASCLDPAHAALVQMTLEEANIPVSLGNANFLSWFWHYSNATDGVTVCVPLRDAERAKEILDVASQKPTESLPPWTCPSCGQQIDGQLDACWQCGHWSDKATDQVLLPSPACGRGAGGGEGGHNETPKLLLDNPKALAEQTSDQPPADAETAPWWNLPRIVTLVASLALLVLFIKCGLLPTLAAASFVVFFVFLLWQFEPSPNQPPEPQIAAEPAETPDTSPQTTKSEISHYLVRRAWQSAVISIAFPPLSFYSMRLLWKISGRDTLLSRADARRFWAAFFLDIIVMAICLMLILSLFFPIIFIWS